MRLERIVPSGWLGALSVVGFLFLTSGIGHADTRHVAMNGVDGPACGSAEAPCRTISQAIALAGIGGRVVVGPGRYGDLNGDGNLGGVGEEPVPGACGCMIHIPQRVTLESTAGAGATVLEALPGLTVVRVQANDVVIGRRSRGFTITGGSVGLQVDPGFADARIGDNLITGNNAVGVSVFGNDHTIVENAAVANVGTGFILGGVTSTGFKISGNFASGNGQQGFTVRGGGFKLTDNVASNNGGTGFSVFYDAFDPSAAVSSNIASGNGDKGFILGTAAGLPATPIARRNAAIGNARGGIFMGLFGVEVTESNIFGNGSLPDVAQAGGLLNCGIISGLSIPVLAENNFWGAINGPGADPADAVCAKGAGPIDTIPFATKAFSISPGAGQ